MAKTFLLPTQRRGLSLIEVMASILIMGALVASMLTSMAGSVRQISTAELQLTAAHLARELLAEWNLRKEDLSAPSSGTIDNLPEWSWTRTSQVREVIPGVTVSEVTLSIARSTDRTEMNPWRREFKIWLNESSTRKSG